MPSRRTLPYIAVLLIPTITHGQASAMSLGGNWAFHEMSGQGMNCGLTSEEIDGLVFAVLNIGFAGDRGFV